MDTSVDQSSPLADQNYVAARDAMFDRARSLRQRIAESRDPFAGHIIQLDSIGHPAVNSPAQIWNVPGKVKPGMHYRHCRHCQKQALVLTVDSSGFCEVMLHPDGTPSIARADDLLPLKHPVPRLSFAQHLDAIASSLDDVRFPLDLRLSVLAGLFSGSWEHEPDALGYAWSVRAHHLVNFCGFSPVLTNWANDLLLDAAPFYDADPEQMPAWLHELAAAPATEADQPWPGRGMSYDEVDAAYRECCIHIRDAVNRLKASLPDDEDQASTTFPRYTVGYTAYNIDNGSAVCIMGPALRESEPGFVDVVDMDTGELDTVHINTLDMDGDSLDHQECLDLIDPDFLHDPRVTYYVAQLASQSLQSASPLVRCLNALVLFRLLFSVNKQGAKIYFQQARTLYKALSSSERSKIAGLAPEILQAKGSALPEPRGSTHKLRDHLQSFYLEESSEADSGASPVVEAPIAPPPQAPHLPAEPIAADDPGPRPSPADPSIKPVTEPQRAPANKPRAKPLRFPTFDYRLLAMEWDLAPSPAGASSFDAAVAATLGWLSDRLGTTLPAQWGRGGHEIELSGVRIQIEADTSLFAVRMEHPDAEHLFRTWFVEANIIAGGDDSNGMVGVRVSVKDRIKAEAPRPSTPGLVEAWMRSPGLLVGGVSTNEITTIDTLAGFEEWDQAWRRPDATHLVLVAPDWACRDLPQRLLANVRRFTMSGPAANAYGQRYGHVHDHQVHVFTPGTFGRADWDIQDKKSIGGLIKAATDIRQRPATPTFNNIRALLREATNAAAAAKPAASTPQDIPQEPQPEAAAIPAPAPAPARALDTAALTDNRVDELQQMLDIALGDLDASQREADDARTELAALRAKVHGLQLQLQTKESAQDSAPDHPENLSGLAAWAPHLAPRLVVTDKAIKSSSRIDHTDPGKIFRALESLASDYWSSRFESDSDAFARWNDFLLQNRLRWGPVGEAADTQRYEGEYQAVWEGRSYTMTHHVAGSSSRDPTKALRIYVAIDEERRAIVVGHLPTHLTNRMT